MPSFQTYKPSAPLSKYIERLWYYEGEDLTHTQERVLPSGAMQIIIDLSSQNLTGLLMCGARSEYTIIQTAWLSSVMGICFRDGSAFPFFNLPMIELHNLDVPLEALWGIQAVNIHERLLEASTVSERFCILEQFLLAQLNRDLLPHPAVMFALDAFNNIAQSPSIASVTDQIGLSQRHFIQVFSQQVGLTPKLYWRVHRFQDVLRTVAHQSVDWADVVNRCGYFDQAHFIHDFKAFSGLTPTDYWRQRIDASNHVPVLE